MIPVRLIQKNEDGFIASEILIAIFTSKIFIAFLVAALIVIGTYSIFQKEINNAQKNSSNESKSEEQVIIFKSNPNVFPSRSFKQSHPAPPPKEPIRSENNRLGGPTSIVTIAGEWHGRYTATKPPMFKGKGGGWEARLSENSAGDISGTFTTEFGISGEVVGKRTGNDATWKVGNGSSGLSYRGTVSGNTISGKFWGEIFQGQNASGTFFGGRIVEPSAGLSDY